MLKVGITGGIGSGKTLICRIFEQLGVPVFYADQAATGIFYRKDTQKIMTKQFGPGILDENGIVDRQKLANMVFSDRDKLEKLNAIIHPMVLSESIEWIKHQKNCRYVLREAAILFESGSNKGLDKIIAISSPVSLRLNRVMQRSGLMEEEVKKRMENQLSDEERAAKSDFVILNDEMHMLITQVLEIHRQLKA